MAISACKGKKQEQEKKQYYPIYAFLEQELSVIDSLPVAILKYHQENQKFDTSITEKKNLEK